MTLGVKFGDFAVIFVTRVLLAYLSPKISRTPHSQKRPELCLLRSPDSDAACVWTDIPSGFDESISHFPVIFPLGITLLQRHLKF